LPRDNQMRHISTTPFGRRLLTAGHLLHQSLSEAPAPVPHVDKWAVLRDLAEARADFGLSDRDVAVLSALASFHQGKILEDGPGLIVFPSNQTLSARLHGMPESTLRRHLAALVKAGVILRHDSPNGKRYALQGGQAFGFDLRPLLIRAEQIATAAQTNRDASRRLRELRQIVVLHLRDASKMLLWAVDNALPRVTDLGAALATLQRHLRRKLGLEQLEEMRRETRRIIDDLSTALPRETTNPSGNDSQNERHIQDSDSSKKESESAQNSERTHALPLELVLKAAPEIANYTPSPIRDWRDLRRVAGFVRPMLGIQPDVWTESHRKMGEDSAAIALACMLERASVIRNPGAYLRSLSKRAESGGFSASAMVMALLREPRAA